jgi:hypothetical protein
MSKAYAIMDFPCNQALAGVHENQDMPGMSRLAGDDISSALGDQADGKRNDIMGPSAAHAGSRDG